MMQQEQQQAAAAAATTTNSSLPSSSERSSSSAAATYRFEIKQGMESDEDMIHSHRVPEFGGTTTNDQHSQQSQSQSQSLNQRNKRGGRRTPADKEHKRLKRLLRNRVSAQQARERKKVQLTDLEAKVKGLEATNSHLEEKLSTLQNENHMLICLDKYVRWLIMYASAN